MMKSMNSEYHFNLEGPFNSRQDRKRQWSWISQQCLIVNHGEIAHLTMLDSFRTHVQIRLGRELET